MSQQLIEYYKSIEESSLKMLDAAKSEDWAQVVRYEGVCAVLIEQLRFQGRTDALLPEHKREKTLIMQRILFNDAQIRFLAEPWLEHMDEQYTAGSRLLH